MVQLNQQQGIKLLALARSTIGEKLGKKKGVFEAETVFDQFRGAFVTLTMEGALRGCIGNIEPVRTITDAIKANALNAAFHDQRFSPLTLKEFENVHISISLLTEPSPLGYEDEKDLVAKLRPGVDGVILRRGRASATFLPQVWDQLEKTELFLSHLCLKAGLPRDAWREGDLEISVYQVQGFSEEQK